jgi:hypothetical protein
METMGIMVLNTAGHSAPPFPEDEGGVQSDSDSEADELVWDDEGPSGPINVYYF